MAVCFWFVCAASQLDAIFVFAILTYVCFGLMYMTLSTLNYQVVSKQLPPYNNVLTRCLLSSYHLCVLTQLVRTNEEEHKLRYFKDDPPAKLCPVEAFLKTMLDVPFAFKRVDVMLYVVNFYSKVNQLRMSYATVEVKFEV